MKDLILSIMNCVTWKLWSLLTAATMSGLSLMKQETNTCTCRRRAFEGDETIKWPW